MKKNLLLTILLVFLMVMNGVLLFLVLNKPDKRKGPPRMFISGQLGFDKGQQSEFLEIDRIHHLKMREISNRSRDLKEYLFSRIGDTNFTEQKLDSITNLIGRLSADKENEVFSYFKRIESICNKDQKIKLGIIVQQALKRGPKPHGPPPPH
ncbi:hypothetical protein [Flagellimonas onchidii]|uniref:hypothetical protein n=1 Tax=Flagellimonas onchidii TaxID=2562684 RepID=UPI0010A6396E|nr:hypothetical protein [Allomuricauda onchidii]